MRQHVDFITLGVAELQPAREFYVDGLGWKPLLDVPGEIVFFQIGHGSVLSIFSRDALREDAGAGAVEFSGGGTPPLSLSHNVGSDLEVELAYAKAIEAGASPVKEPCRAAFGGFHAYFTDPDGYLWEICHNPGWSVDRDGTVRLEPVGD